MDIMFAQFQFLRRLLLVHGHWCFRGISSMVQIKFCFRKSKLELFITYDRHLPRAALQIYYFHKKITFSYYSFQIRGIHILLMETCIR